MHRFSFILILSCVLAVVIAATVRADLQAEDAFAEVFVSLGDTHLDGTIPARIDSLWLLSGEVRMAIEQSLKFGCRPGQPGWFFDIAPGDTLQIEWQVLREPSTGWLFFGGKGGVARLTIPGEGWFLPCTCDGQSEVIPVSLSGVIVTDDGAFTRTQEIVGRNEAVIPRILPFWSGNKPQPPRSLRLFLFLEDME